MSWLYFLWNSRLGNSKWSI